MIHIRKVKKSEEAMLHNLMQFYIYDFSKYISEIKLEDDCTYKPFELSQYWEEKTHHAFFICLDAKIIGFTLVDIEEINRVLEFFVLASYQSKGVGKAAARKLFESFSGYWKVSQIEKNYPAKAFWRSLIFDVTNGEMEEEYREGKCIQSFHTSSLSI
ncbi:Predicted acetyltransferase [Terribacillus halophilus]|uniref:Predicted acetyltransferase n=1 Tax=Terribacillus halophilus TaxID=361279 RepID=A0A1G6U284_9BACI|nr:GNAT family N-acetyltransferase [Terribacillus halophilus]SDD35512.1 Predicted acetyltransferase [Terribacillus halophilus]